MSSPPWVYHTLHKEFGPPTVDPTTNCGTSLGRRKRQFSSSPREYYTLHVDFGPPTKDSKPNCEPGLGRPGRGNCHPYRGNTILCMSTLEHRIMDSTTNCRTIRGGLEGEDDICPFQASPDWSRSLWSNPWSVVQSRHAKYGVSFGADEICSFQASPVLSRSSL